MELSAKYAYAVYEKRSFSLAAKELFVSQPALSAMVAKLERELGFRIFERPRGGIITPTPRGQIYLDMLEEMRQSERTMKQRLELLEQVPEEHLNVGAIMVAAYSLLSESCYRFRERYPRVSVSLDMGTVGPHGVLHDKLARGELDMILSYKVDGTRFDALPLWEERFIVVLRRDCRGAEHLLPYALSREEILTRRYTEEQMVSDLSVFDTVEFIGNDTFPSAYRNSLLGAHHAASHVSLPDARTAFMHYYLVRAGLGATVMADLNVADPIFDGKGFLYVALNVPKSNRSLYLLRRKREPLNPTAQRFADILTECCEERFSAAYCAREDGFNDGAEGDRQ